LVRLKIKESTSDKAASRGSQVASANVREFSLTSSLLSNLQLSDRLVVVASGEGAWNALVEIVLRRLIQ
jgi:hypothetical protein